MEKLQECWNLSCTKEYVDRNGKFCSHVGVIKPIILSIKWSLVLIIYEAMGIVLRSKLYIMHKRSSFTKVLWVVNKKYVDLTVLYLEDVHINMTSRRLWNWYIWKDWL